MRCEPWIRQCVAGLSICLACAVFAWARTDEPPTTAPSEPATRPADTPAAPVATAPARDEAWVSGTVLDVDGKPKPELEIRIERMDPLGMGGGGQTSRRPRVIHGTTDAEGNFTFRNLDPDRQYTVIAGSNEIGWVFEEVTPPAGKITALGQLKMFKID